MRHTAGLRVTAIAWTIACLAPTIARADCEAYWMRVEGKDEQQVLRLPTGFSLEQFTHNEPRWEPYVYDANGRSRGPASPSALAWAPLTRPPEFRLVGRLGGKRVYLVRYSPLSLALIAEQGSSYCPSLLLDAGDEGGPGQVVAFIGEPEIFSWQKAELLSLRYYIRGTGSLQESLFLTPLGGHVIYLKQQPWPDESTTRAKWILGSHGGGFCRNSLVAQYRTAGDSPAQGIVRARYRLRGRTLAIESLSLVQDRQSLDSCDIYYEMRRPR